MKDFFEGQSDTNISGWKTLNTQVSMLAYETVDVAINCVFCGKNKTSAAMSALNIEHNTKQLFKILQTEQNVKESKVKSEFPQLCKFLSGLIFCLSFDLFKSSQPTLHQGRCSRCKVASSAFDYCIGDT